MKIKFLCLCLLICLSITLVSCKDDKYHHVKMAEVAHSVFYAPQYIAIELGYFEEVGIKIDLYNANGADKVTSSLLSGDIDIGLQGPEPTIYLYNNGYDDYLVNFAQLTNKDGSFIFGREPIENFTLQHLKGKSILGGRSGGVPLMSLEYAIKQAGLTISHNELTKDVNVRTDVAFGAMAGSFLNGEGDFTTLFEPVATSMLKEGKIFLLDSVAKYSGEIAFTGYCCKKSYLEKNQDVIKNFCQAIYLAQQYVLNNTDEDVAKVLHQAFPEETVDTLTSVVKRYRELEAWTKTPVFIEHSFNNLQKVMITAGELNDYVPFNTLVDTSIAKQII